MPARRPARALSAEMFALFRKDFDHMDRDSNGVIEPAEVRTMLQEQLGRNPSDEEFKCTMDLVDVNHDGQVGFHEYITAVCGSGWTIIGDCDLNISLLFDRYVNAELMRKRSKQGGALGRKRSSFETRQNARIDLKGFKMLGRACGLFEFNQNFTESSARQLWKEFVREDEKTAAMGFNQFTMVLASATDLIGIPYETFIGRLNEAYSSSGHFLESRNLDNSDEANELRRTLSFAQADVISEFVTEEGESIAPVVLLDDGTESFGGKWDVESGNERGVDHTKVAVDGRELFERFAAFGVGREKAEVGEGGLRNIEMDSSAFIKFFRESKLLNTKPDYLKEASVDIWWTSMNLKLKQADPENVAHVNYEAFHEHVIKPLAINKRVGEQLLVAMCLARLPQAHTADYGTATNETESQLAHGHASPCAKTHGHAPSESSNKLHDSQGQSSNKQTVAQKSVI